MDRETAKCSTCGQSAQGMTILVNGATLQRELLCGRCAALGHAQTLNTLEEADHFIDEATETLKKLEKIILAAPEMPTVPDDLQEITRTPLTVYKTLQEHLEAFKIRKIELITQVGRSGIATSHLKQPIDTQERSKTP